MKTRLLTVSEVEHLINVPAHAFSDEETLLLCTIVEALLVAEKVKKGHSTLDWDKFQRGFAQAIKRSIPLIIIPLDVACLQRALFEPQERYWESDFWSSGVEQKIAPQRVRRLILRPSEETWWEDELYDEMESWPQESAHG